MKKGDRIRCTRWHTMCPEHLKMRELGVEFPEFGRVYTIRGLNGYDGVWLEEITNPNCTHTGHEVGFHFEYFQPMEDNYQVY